MKSTHKQIWYLCDICIIIKFNMMFLNTYPFGNQDNLLFILDMFRNLLLPDFSVTDHSGCRTVLLLMKTAVFN